MKKRKTNFTDKANVKVFYK